MRWRSTPFRMQTCIKMGTVPKSVIVWADIYSGWLLDLPAQPRALASLFYLEWRLTLSRGTFILAKCPRKKRDVIAATVMIKKFINITTLRWRAADPIVKWVLDITIIAPLSIVMFFFFILVLIKLYDMFIKKCQLIFKNIKKKRKQNFSKK